jgi:hypothetical protein
MHEMSIQLVAKKEDLNSKLYNTFSEKMLRMNPLLTLLKTKRIYFIQGLSPYRAVNTLYLGYKKQTVNVVAVCSEIHTKYIQCEHHLEFLSVKPGGTYNNS